jgi:hypothetical protein
MYNNANAILRPELTAVVNESQGADLYFIGPIVFPPVMRKRVAGQYRKITKAASATMKKQKDTIRAPKSGYERITRTFELDDYRCKDRGLEELIDDNEAKEVQDWFSMETTTSNLVRRAIQFNHEARIAAKTFDDTVFDSNEAGTAYTRAALATFDVATDMQAAINLIKRRGEMANTAIMNRNVWERIRMSTLLGKFMFGSLAGTQQITPESLAKALGLARILIAEASWDTSAQGKNEETSYIWSEEFIFIGNIQTGEVEAGGLGRTFIWEQAAPGLFQVETYRVEEKKSDCIRVFQHTDEKVVSVPAGTLIETGWTA